MFNLDMSKGVSPILIPIFAGVVILFIVGGILIYHYWLPELKPECAKDEDCGKITCQQGRDKCIEIKYVCKDDECSSVTEEFLGYICQEDGKCAKKEAEKEEIQTGKIEINYDEIEELQKAVDEGHQPWRLSPDMVAMSELPSYGFTENDITTLFCPHIASNLVLGKDVTELPCEIDHGDKKYDITVEQPNPGVGKIWIVSDVELDETAGWQTYRNETYGYEVRYPKEWTGGEASTTTKVASFTPEERDVAQTGFWIYIYENPRGLTPQEWWGQEYQKGVAIYTYKGTFVISGTNAEVYEGEGGLGFTYYLLPKNLRIYLIFSPLIEEKRNQILSTFRFIEESDLTLEKLENAEYPVVSYNKRVRLEDGQYFKQWEPDSASGLSVSVYNDKVAFGDLNNDGKEDAVVVLTASGGGSGSFRELAVLVNKDGNPSYLTSQKLGDRVIINSITIDSGIITIDMIVHGPEDGLCCPSVEKIFKYKLSNNHLIEAE